MKKTSPRRSRLAEVVVVIAIRAAIAGVVTMVAVADEDRAQVRAIAGP